ncbi:MAG: hypothetical protein IJW52_02465 [Clostridia bacterium]|nr:hypothetical protein [Clostridia bacterium]
MKKEDIFNAFEELDPKFIEEAAPKMNKVKKNTFVLRIAAVAACVALLVSVVVVSTLMLNREDEDPPDVPSETITPDEKAEYIMYIDVGMDANAPPLETDKFTVKTDSAEELDLSCLNRIEKESVENTTNQISLDLLNNHWKLEYNRTFERGLYHSDNFSHLGTYDEYVSDDAVVYINKINGELMFLSDKEIDRTAEGDFSIEEGKQAAKEILAILYGEEVLEYYGEPIFSDTVLENNLSLGQEVLIKVVYEKAALGYRTDDRITVKFNREGKLVSINAMKRNTMTRVEEDITKEQTDKALNVLKQQFPNDKIESAIISVAADGKYYITTTVIRYLSMHPVRYPLKLAMNIQ